jgi:hypothetical protein
MRGRVPSWARDMVSSLLMHQRGVVYEARYWLGILEYSGAIQPGEFHEVIERRRDCVGATPPSG